MGKRKRAASRSGLIGKAVTAGRGALREAQRRIPPDLRRQLERRLKEGQKTFATSLKQVQTRLNRAASQADVDRLAHRIEELTRKVEQLSRQSPARRPARRRSSSRQRAASKPNEGSSSTS